MSNAYGKSPKGSTPTSSSNGHQPTQPAQQKFTSGIAQPSRSSSGLSAALAGSPSWMTPPAAHTPFQLPANLPGIMNPPAVQRPQMMPGSPLVQSPNPQSGIMGLSHLTGMGGTGLSNDLTIPMPGMGITPTQQAHLESLGTTFQQPMTSTGPAGISSVMRAPGPAPTPVYQGPGTAQWNPATQTWDRTDQGPQSGPGLPFQDLKGPLPLYPTTPMTAGPIPGPAGNPANNGPGPAPGPNMTYVPSGLQTPGSQTGSWVPNSQGLPGPLGPGFATLF